MPLYVLPPIVERASEFATLVSRSGATLIEPSHLYEIYPAATGGGIVILALQADQLTLLSRYMSDLLPEVPTQVASVPACNYPVDWLMVAAPLPAIDYMELSAKLAKSGLLSHTPKQVQERGHARPRRETGLGAPRLGGLETDEHEEEEVPDGDDEVGAL